MREGISFRTSRRKPKFVFSYILSIIFIISILYSFYINIQLDLQILMYLRIGLLAITCLIILNVEWKRHLIKYSIRGHAITESRGFLRKREITINAPRITDIKSTQGIVGKIFGIATIQVYTGKESMNIIGINNASKITQILLDSIESKTTESDHYSLKTRFPDSSGGMGVFR